MILERKTAYTATKITCRDLKNLSKEEVPSHFYDPEDGVISPFHDDKINNWYWINNQRGNKILWLLDDKIETTKLAEGK